jgi:hypothetical protein
MDESALRTLLNSLEASRSSLHGLLHIFTWFVVVGLAFDLFVIIKEFRDDWEDFRYGQIHPYENHLPKQPSVLLLMLALLGTALIVIGVAGELYVDVRAGKIETQIREANDNLLGLSIQEAGDAKSSAEDAASAAASAQSSADGATGSADKAQQRVAVVAKHADELNRELLTTKTQLATVEAKRAELEKSLVNLAICNAPRVIPLWSINAPGNAVTKTAVDPLKPHAGWQFVIEYVPFDAEARRAAANVAGALEGAGWKMAKASQVDGIDDGVEVRAYFNRKAEPQEWGLHVNSQEAADTLIDFLHSYNWEVKPGWASHTDTDIPPNGIKIRVGLYPAVSYVSPPGAKDLAAAIAQFEQERQKMTKQMEEKQLEREEEMLKHLTPQQAAEHKARMEQRKEEQKLWMERYSGPCQPLTPLSPIVR